MNQNLRSIVLNVHSKQLNVHSKLLNGDSKVLNEESKVLNINFHKGYNLFITFITFIAL